MTQPFHRTRFTWLAYLLLAYFAFLQTLWGPIVPLLRDDLNLNYTQGGFHATAFALGMVLAGVISDRVAAWLGDQRTFWLGGCGMAAGALLLMIAPHLVVTLSAAFIMGLCGTVLLVMIQSGLANAHRQSRGVAIAEANIFASIGSTLAPLTVSAFVLAAIGWRWALLVPVTLFVILLFTNQHQPFPSLDATGNDDHSAGFSIGFWLIWLGLVLGVAAEWSIAFWTADFLITVLEQPPGMATASVAIFTASGIIGRWSTARLAGRFSDRLLLMMMLVIALVGALIFRFSGLLILTWGGLAITGFGVATVYPLGVSTLINFAPEHSNRASARASLGAAIAILIAPQSLGILADMTDIATASTLIPVLIIGTLILTAIGGQSRE